MSETIRYNLSIPDVHRHLIEVELRVERPQAGTLGLTMPSWSPGSYLLREYGRHVQAFEAHAGQAALGWRKRTRNRWEIDVPQDCSALVVRYRVFSHDYNVRANHVEDTHAFINGPSTFMLVDGHLESTHQVKVQAPFEDWRIHTGLERADGKPKTPMGEAIFEASDFDELVDCPLTLAPVDAIEFKAGGKRQQLVLVGRNDAPVEKMLADMTGAIESSAEFFGGLPYERYLTVILHNDTGRGGLEHRNSTILMYYPYGYSTDEGYEDFLTLFCHEHFHVWNIKRIRPAVLGPFDYANENYTRALWIVEGITCYYENVLLLRGGLMTPERFLELLGKRIGTLQNTPGRKLHSLEQASFDAWIKLYRQDESTPNTSVSYYLKGEIVAWALDMTIRARTGGQRSLDDIMLTLWGRYQETGEGFPEETFQQDAEAIVGCELGDFFDAYIRGRQELDYDALLASVGMTLQPAKEPPSHGWMGINTSRKGDRVIIKNVLTDGPSADAGLYADDELLAIDGMKVDRDSFKGRLERHKPGQTVNVHVFRRGALRQAAVTLGQHPVAAYKLVAQEEEASDQALAIRQAWLKNPTQSSSDD